ncbi:MAG: thioredoxin family protein [Candidatus Altiarchaeota archaeon]|nr:thioredoxin family protein [Candidatus Altiarchaeota archaeon]
MAELNIEVFTSPTCPHCPAAVRATEELLAEHPELEGRIKWKEMSTATQEGHRKAVAYGIMAVPTIVLTNTKTGQKGGIRGAPTKAGYLKAISEMLAA